MTRACAIAAVVSAALWLPACRHAAGTDELCNLDAFEDLAPWKATGSEGVTLAITERPATIVISRSGDPNHP